VLHARRVTQVDAAPRATSVAVTATGPFTVRAPRAGDRLPLAGGGTQALGKLLAGAGVPARHRSGVPVVVQDRRVVWVAGYRADPTLIAAPGARATVLEVTPA
jgi:tRNA(Ile)-lysidine synthetase-like protein